MIMNVFTRKFNCFLSSNSVKLDDTEEDNIADCLRAINLFGIQEIEIAIVMNY